jgi:hypothetical protein
VLRAVGAYRVDAEVGRARARARARARLRQERGGRPVPARRAMTRRHWIRALGGRAERARTGGAPAVGATARLARRPPRGSARERPDLRRAGHHGRRPAAGHDLSPRTRLLLEGPILATLLRLAWPNVLLMVVQSSTGLVETYWVSKRGTAALAGMARGGGPSVACGGRASPGPACAQRRKRI